MATAIDMEAESSILFDVEEAVQRSHKRTFDMFHATQRLQGPDFPEAQRVRVAARVLQDYPQAAMPELARPPAKKAAEARGGGGSSASALLTNAGPAPLMLMDAASSRPGAARSSGSVGASSSSPSFSLGSGTAGGRSAESTALTVTGTASTVRDVIGSFSARAAPAGLSGDDDASREAYAKVEDMTSRAQEKSRAILARRQPAAVPEPKWHAPWKLMRVISGHLGWVRAIAVEPGNEWFVTGGGDRLIKVWDLASGTLKVTLTGHINAVRGLAVSSRHPYMFSAGEDKQVFCWDLEYNKVIRKYTGHLSGVYSLALHPTLDVVLTGGRDSVCRVWDMRTRTQVHVLSGHDNSITSILANGSAPEVITGSQDSTIRTWDLAAGKVRSVLTHHKKGVRGMASHPKEWAFMSGAADNIKKWALPDSTFVRNFSGHNSIINSLALNADDVLVSGGDDGSMHFWDYKTGYRFQSGVTKPQPGSLDCETGVFASTFDQTGLRLITCEADKTIKMWREDPDASPESHPVDMAAWTAYCRQHKVY